MISKAAKITNEMGFHMRPANIFVTEMTKFKSNIDIVLDGKKSTVKAL